MSQGHSGRCFRAWRRLKARKPETRFPIRQKVPHALRPFLTGPGKKAGANAMTLAITRYAQHQAMIGAPRRGGARGT